MSKHKPFSRLFGIAIAGICLMVLSAHGSGEVKSGDDPNIAKNFTLTNYDGKPIQLSGLTKKIVVLEWFNYDCPFVKAHYREQTTKKLVEKYKKQDVVWLLINSTHYMNQQNNKDFAEANQIKFPILMDQDGKVGKLYGAMTTPHIFVIDKNGKIAYQGAYDNAPLGKKPEKEQYVNYAEKAVDELLAGKKVTISKTKPYGCSVKYPPAPEKK